MAAPFYWLGRRCIRFRWLVLGVWVVVVVALVLWAGHVGAQTSDNLTLPGSDSQQATDTLTKRFPAQANGTNPIPMEPPGGAKLTDKKYADAVNATTKAFQADHGVSSAISPLSQAGRNFLSKDGRIGYISVVLKDSPSQLSEDEAHRILKAEQPARDAGMMIAAGGYLGQKVSRPSTESSEVVGLTAAVVILLFTFGTVVAMGLPIITAILGLAAGLSIVALLGQVVEVPTISPTLATMIGLGVGIDYALFIVTRHKAQVAGGLELQESVARAVATSGGAVAFAGGTVIVALCSLVFAGIPLVTTLGYTAAIAVFIAVLAAVTLLPALLAILDRHIYSLKLPLPEPKHAERPHGWARWARFVARNPVPAIVVSVVFLLVLAFPVRNLHLGQADTGALPESTTARQANDLLVKGFGPGAAGPLLVSVELSKPATSPSDSRLTDLEATLRKEPGVASVTPPTVGPKGTSAIYTVTPTTAPWERETENLVKHLRGTTLPAATQGKGMEASVGGRTAGFIDLAEQISSKLPLVIAIVVGLAFLLLMLAFRSIAIPLKAALMNLISIGAAFGVVTFVFQEGHGAKLLGLPGPVPIVSFVPLMMFAILFGLSMDYEVFLMSHMQEHFRMSGDNHEAVVDGLAATARVITSAALIMVCVFASFILNGDPTVKQFGVGLSVAIAVDATVVRCLLVPAVMAMMGEANWWMPVWLDRRLPRISIEGDEYFAERDREVVA
jgi:putative drug exporter of the RND superfamily